MSRKPLTLARAIAYIAFLLLGIMLGVALKRAVAAEPSPPAAAPAVQPASSSVCDPKAAALIAECIEAMGGREAVQRVRARKAEGTVSIPAANVSGRITVTQAADGRFASVTDLGLRGRIVRGSDGVRAWECRPGTPARLLDAAERDALLARMQRLFIVPLDPEAGFRSIVRAGSEHIGDEEFEKVVATPKAGPVETWWFSVKTRLLVHEDTAQPTPAGEVVTRLTHTDFVRKDGVLSPMGAVQAAGGMQTRFTTDQATLVYNPALTEADFAPPAEVRALIEK